MRKLVMFAALLALAASLTAWAAAGTSKPAKRTAHAAVSQQLAVTLSQARLATAKYVTNLAAAKAAGYSIITKMIPNMGYHFMNAKITGFDVTRPPILVYEKDGSTWQLGALEWVFTVEAEDAAAAGCALRRVRGCLSLRRRHGRAGDDAGRLPEDGARLRCGIRLLAPGPGHAARVALVPEPGRSLLGNEPAREPVQRGLGEQAGGQGGAPAGGAPLSTTRLRVRLPCSGPSRCAAGCRGRSARAGSPCRSRGRCRRRCRGRRW